MNSETNFYDDLGDLERYLNLPNGSLRQIPIYARRGVADSILKVRELEKHSLFRPGLYYIVLADLCSNTDFNDQYGDKECDLRTQWFHTAAVEAIGKIELRNYIAFNKTIGDASLLIFSSFQDVFDWSEQFDKSLDTLSQEYAGTISDRDIAEGKSDRELEELVDASNHQCEQCDCQIEKLNLYLKVTNLERGQGPPSQQRDYLA